MTLRSTDVQFQPISRRRSRSNFSVTMRARSAGSALGLVRRIRMHWLSMESTNKQRSNGKATATAQDHNVRANAAPPQDFRHSGETLLARPGVGAWGSEVGV